MNEKLNIQDLTDSLAEKHGMSKKNAESFVKEFFQLIEESLEKDNYVKIKGLGTFKLIDVDSRESINVNTGERFEIQGHTKVSFTPDAALKDSINKPFAHFETVALNDNAQLEDTPDAPAEIGGGEEVRTVRVENQSETVQRPKIVIPPMSTDEVIQLGEEVTPPTAEEQVEAAESPKDNQPDSKKKKDKDSSSKYLIGIILFVVVACAGIVIYLYYPELFASHSSKEAKPDTAVVAPVNTVVPSGAEATKDSVPPAAQKEVPAPVQTAAKPAPKSETQQAPQTVAKPAPKPVVQPAQTSANYEPDSTNYIIVGTETTYTIQPGETLTKVSLRFYGTKALYPYIVKHNPKVIKKPDNVPAGTKIKIPKLKKK